MKQEGKKKKLAIGVLASALVLTMSIGGTLAYMTRETEKRVNNFTFAGNDALDAMLTEPAWDGIIGYEYDSTGAISNVIYDYIDHDADASTPDVPVFGYVGGDLSVPVTDPAATEGRGVKPTKDSTNSAYAPKYGEDMAKNMIPGQTALKNPMITNTGDLMDEWIAAKVTFVYSTGANAGTPLGVADMTKVNDCVDISWNDGTANTEWERVIGSMTDVSQTFYYRSILACGAETTPIFTSLTVKATATQAQLAALDAIGGFTIYVEGFAVQSEIGATYAEFRTWGIGTDTTAGTDDDQVIFTNTPTATTPVVLTANKGIVPKA